MHAAGSHYGFITHRTSRAFFLAHTAQQVETRRVLRELVRAAAALAGIFSWGGVLLMLAG